MAQAKGRVGREGILGVELCLACGLGESWPALRLCFHSGSVAPTAPDLVPPSLAVALDVPRLYHSLCATASGSFLSMKTLQLLCPEHSEGAAHLGEESCRLTGDT